MPVAWGNIIVLAALTAAVALAVRSLRKSRRTGGHCTGDCTACGVCHGGRNTKQSVNSGAETRRSEKNRAPVE